MALPYQIDQESFDALPEAVQEHYGAVEGEDGTFALGIEGDIPEVTAASARVKEFRTTNLDLMKERDTLQSQVDDLRGESETNVAEKNSVEARLARMEKLLAGETEKRQAAERRVADTEFNRIVRKAATAAGVPASALEDATDHLRNRRGMRLEGDAVQAEDGTTLKQALRTMKKEAPYFFAASSGAGTRPGGGTKSGGTARVITVTDGTELLRLREKYKGKNVTFKYEPA